MIKSRVQQRSLLSEIPLDWPLSWFISVPCGKIWTTFYNVTKLQNYDKMINKRGNV